MLWMPNSSWKSLITYPASFIIKCSPLRWIMMCKIPIIHRSDVCYGVGWRWCQIHATQEHIRCYNKWIYPLFKKTVLFPLQEIAIELIYSYENACSQIVSIVVHYCSSSKKMVANTADDDRLQKKVSVNKTSHDKIYL